MCPAWGGARRNNPVMVSSVAPRIVGCILPVLLGGCSTLPQLPADGLYAGELCTAVVGGPLNCGAADVFLSNRRAKVRVSDFMYDLELDQELVEVMLVHGRTLVDVWSASYSWDDHYLRFIDQERRTLYRVRFANRAQGSGPGRRED